MECEKSVIPRSSLDPSPLETAHTLPSACYTDPDWARVDMDAVLWRRWQYVGHTGQVPLRGDVAVRTVLGQPVLLVRDHDDTLRAFYNVCKHRGGPLAEHDGHCRLLQCKYHGWTYKLDGSLRGVPKFKYTELFDKKDYGLTPVRLQEWEGFLFACFSEPADLLGDFLGGIVEEVAPIRLADFVFHSRETYRVNCNWKVYADNYLEGYHVPHVHPELCELLDMDAYRTIVDGWRILQDSPLKAKESIYSGGDEKAWYYFVYPNFMLNILPGRMQINQILPVSADQCEVHFDYYYTPETLAAKPELPAQDRGYSAKVQAEDIAICEHVQRGLSSPAYDRGRFSVETEAGPHHFQELLKQDYRRYFAGDKP